MAVALAQLESQLRNAKPTNSASYDLLTHLIDNAEIKNLALKYPTRTDIWIKQAIEKLTGTPAQQALTKALQREELDKDPTIQKTMNDFGWNNTKEQIAPKNSDPHIAPIIASPRPIYRISSSGCETLNVSATNLEDAIHAFMAGNEKKDLAEVNVIPDRIETQIPLSETEELIQDFEIDALPNIHIDTSKSPIFYKDQNEKVILHTAQKEWVMYNPAILTNIATGKAIAHGEKKDLQEFNSNQQKPNTVIIDCKSLKAQSLNRLTLCPGEIQTAYDKTLTNAPPNIEQLKTRFPNVKFANFEQTDKPNFVPIIKNTTPSEEPEITALPWTSQTIEILKSLNKAPKNIPQPENFQQKEFQTR